MSIRRTPSIAVVLLAAAFIGAQPPCPRLQGPYLGQEPPGLAPRPFAPGLVTTDADEGCCGFALKGTVCAFQRFIEGRCRTYITRLENGVWTAPDLIPFWETLAENGDLVFSSDDRTMLYQVRTMSEQGPLSHVWRAEVTSTGWGERTPFPAPVNTPYFESYASGAANGALYFFSRRPGGRGRFDLYRSAFEAGAYAEPINLDALNTESDEWDPFIEPDESYIIFCSQKPGGLGRDDLYISFRGQDGRWGAPVNLGAEINSPGSENRPAVTRDGKYFFYTSTRNGSRDVFWIATAYLDRFKK